MVIAAIRGLAHAISKAFSIPRALSRIGISQSGRFAAAESSEPPESPGASDSPESSRIRSMAASTSLT